jgi:hypothetical protein
VPANLAAAVADALEHLPGAGELTRELACSGTLTARRERLRDTLTVAIDEAGETVVLECRRLLRRQAAAADVRARVATLAALLDLLERLSEEAEPRGGAAVDVDRLTGDEGRGV